MAKQIFLDTFDNFIRKTVQELDAESGKFVVRGRQIVSKSNVSVSSLYNHGGYQVFEDNRNFINYEDNTGKLHIDIEKAREYYELE